METINSLWATTKLRVYFKYLLLDVVPLTETFSGKVLCITNKSDSSKEISAGSAEQDKELSDNSALLNSSVKLDHIDELLVKEGILLQVPNYKGNVPVHIL